MYILNDRLTLSGLTFLFILFSHSAFASDPYAVWVYPAWGAHATATLNYLDTINVSWKSNYPNPYLARWCESEARIWTRCSDDPVNSTGTLPIKLDGGNMAQTCGPNVGCHMELYVPADSSTYESNSDPLHVTANAAAQPTTWSAQPPSTASTPSPTTDPATTATSSSPTTQPTLVNTSAAPSPSPSTAPSTLSHPAKAGIALSATFAALLLGLLAFLTYRFRRLKRNAPTNLPELGRGSDSLSWRASQQPTQQMPMGELEPGLVGELGGTWVRELEPGAGWVRELEGVPVGGLGSAPAGEKVGRRGF